MTSSYPRYVDVQLWRKIQRYSEGDISEKIQSIDMIYGNPEKLPRQYINILRTNAGKDQPYEVRLLLAKQFSKNPPPTVGERTSLLTLEKPSINLWPCL